MSTFGDALLGGTFGDASGTFADEGAGATWPSWTIELSLEVGPLETPTSWEVIDDYVAAFTIVRGRSGELGQYQPGTLALELDDPARHLDPENTASPFWPQIASPNRRVRVRAEWDSVTYQLFDGYLDDHDRAPLEYSTSHEYARIDLTATDAFKLLAEREMKPARPFTVGDPQLGVLDDPSIAIGGGALEFPEQRTGQRIKRALELLGWPANLLDIDEGLTLVLADQPTDDALTYLQRLARDEYGDLFVSELGLVTFRERRHWTRNSRATTSTATYSDDVTELAGGASPYTRLKLQPASGAQLRNIVRRARDDGFEVTKTDLASVTNNGAREDSVTDSLVASKAELADQASYVLERFHEPQTWIDTLELAYDPDPDTLWPLMLATTYYDRVTAQRSPVTGTPIDHEAWVCGLRWQVTAADRTATLELTLQAVEVANYFTIGHSTLGKLDHIATLPY